MNFSQHAIYSIQRAAYNIHGAYSMQLLGQLAVTFCVFLVPDFFLLFYAILFYFILIFSFCTCIQPNRVDSKEKSALQNMQHVSFQKANFNFLHKFLLFAVCLVSISNWPLWNTWIKFQCGLDLNLVHNSRLRFPCWYLYSCIKPQPLW